jgi:hypothetical protein
MFTSSGGPVVAVDQDDLVCLGPDLRLAAAVKVMAHADHVLGELGLAFCVIQRS